MRVVVTDRRYTNERPYREVVEREGGELVDAKWENERELIASCEGADVVLLSKTPMTKNVINELESVQFIIRIGTGFDNINVKAATEQGIVVGNTPGYSQEEVATHALTLMLAAARDVAYLDRNMRKANGFGDRRRINRLTGGTVGIVGLGRIGRALVPKVHGLDMDVIAFDPYVPADVFNYLDVSNVSFEELLSRADCVSVHAPLTAETHHLFSEAEFDQMKESAVFVNTARGPIVDENALVDAIESGSIWGGGIDVFETEPPVDTPALSCDRLVCSPHHAGKCRSADEQCIETVTAALDRILTGRHPEYIVNPEVYQYGDDLLNPEYDV